MSNYTRGDTVKWKWGQGHAEGEVVQVHKNDATHTIKGKEIKRHATSDCPAYLIKQSNGNRVFKSHSELA